VCRSPGCPPCRLRLLRQGSWWIRRPARGPHSRSTGALQYYGVTLPDSALLVPDNADPGRDSLLRQVLDASVLTLWPQDRADLGDAIEEVRDISFGFGGSRSDMRTPRRATVNTDHARRPGWLACQRGHRPEADGTGAPRADAGDRLDAPSGWLFHQSRRARVHRRPRRQGHLRARGTRHAYCTLLSTNRGHPPLRNHGCAPWRLQWSCFATGKPHRGNAG
jgi:hypothetical protein